MNEMDTQSQSDTTNELPSILRDNLEMGGELDFINTKMSPSVKKTIAELMGLNTSPLQPNDIDIETSKNLLLLKLKILQPGDLDEITEERSEDIDPSEIDRTDCSFLSLRKNDSIGAGFVRSKFYAEFIQGNENSLHLEKTKSTRGSTKNTQQPDMKLLNKNFVTAIRRFHADSEDNQFCILKDLDSVNESNDDITDNNCKEVDYSKNEIDANEDVGYDDEMERFKKKRKPLEVNAVEKDHKLDGFQFSEIRRVNLNAEQPIKFVNSTTTTKISNSGTSSTNILITESNSLNPETSQQETESCSLFSGSILKPNPTYNSNDKLDQKRVENTKPNIETVKRAKLSKSRDLGSRYIDTSGQIYSHRLMRQHIKMLKKEKLSKSEKKLPLYIRQNFSLMAKYIIPEEKKSTMINSSLPLEHLNMFNNEVNDQGTLLDRVYSQLSTKSRKALSSVAQICGKKIDTGMGESQLSINENINMQNSKKLDANPLTHRSVSNVNSKLKLFFQNNGSCTKSKVLIRKGTMADFNWIPDDKFFSTLKSRTEYIKPQLKPKTSMNKNYSMNSNELLTRIKRVDDYLLNIGELPRVAKREKTESKPSTVSRSKIEISRFPHKIHKEKKVIKNKCQDQVQILTRGRFINDYVKRNKEELEKQKDVNYGLKKTVVANTKICSKAKGMLKRGC